MQATCMNVSHTSHATAHVKCIITRSAVRGRKDEKDEIWKLIFQKRIETITSCACISQLVRLAKWIACKPFDDTFLHSICWATDGGLFVVYPRLFPRIYSSCFLRLNDKHINCYIKPRHYRCLGETGWQSVIESAHTSSCSRALTRRHI